MAKTDLNIIKNWFKTGLKPTQAQFWTTWDSFWHKDEKLPISSIENLGNILDNKAENNHLHNEYATNDATSLNEENISRWRNSLGIKDVELTDETVKLTQSYEDFGIEAGSSQSLLNQTFASQIFNRVEIPEENADADHVLLADGSTLAKTEFGSNSTVMGIAPDENKNIDISSVAMDWKNPSQKFSGLQDKSNDDAFNQLLGKDSNGNIAGVGLNAVTKAMQNSNDAQKDAWRISQRKTNETYSLNQPRIDLIIPPIQEKSEIIQYITLKGQNLFILFTEESGSYVKLKHTTSSFEHLVDVVTVNQSDVGFLSFAINNQDFPVGDYAIEIYNGITQQVNIDGKVIKIVDDLIPTTINDLMWETVIADGYNLIDNDTELRLITSTPYSFNSVLSMSKSRTILTKEELQNNDYWIKITINAINTYHQFGGYILGVLDSNRVINLNTLPDIGSWVQTRAGDNTWWIQHLPSRAVQWSSNYGAEWQLYGTRDIQIIKVGNVFNIIEDLGNGRNMNTINTVDSFADLSLIFGFKGIEGYTNFGISIKSIYKI